MEFTSKRNFAALLAPRIELYCSLLNVFEVLTRNINEEKIERKRKRDRKHYTCPVTETRRQQRDKNLLYESRRRVEPGRSYVDIRFSGIYARNFTDTTSSILPCSLARSVPTAMKFRHRAHYDLSSEGGNFAVRKLHRVRVIPALICDEERQPDFSLYDNGPGFPVNGTGILIPRHKKGNSRSSSSSSRLRLNDDASFLAVFTFEMQPLSLSREAN